MIIRTNIASHNKIHRTQSVTVAKILKRQCFNYLDKGSPFLNIIRNMDGTVLIKIKLQVLETLPYDDNSSKYITNTLILNVTIEFQVYTRSDVSLLDWI